MSEPIDRVISAILDAQARQLGPEDVARAAITSIREPTAEMLRAAAPFPLALVLEKDDVDYTKKMEAATLADRLAARSTYQKMIDEVLK